MKSKFYENVACIIGIVGGIASIVMGFIFPAMNYNSVTEEYTTGFNFGITIGCVVSVVILCLAFSGISSILGYLEELGAGKKEEAPPQIQMQQTTEKVESGDWMCPDCGKVNKKYVASCGCGYTKNKADFWTCPECHLETPYSAGSECPNCHYKP